MASSCNEKYAMQDWEPPFHLLGAPNRWEFISNRSMGPCCKPNAKKLATWQGKILSLGGRITLIKASLSCLPIYFLSIFPIPMSVIEKINKIQRKFLWCGHDKKNYLALAPWKLIELPKTLGGLSVGNLLHRNLALLFKWV